MIRSVCRHPHVFADVTVSGADEVKRNWDEIKREEKRAKAERLGDAADDRAAPSALDGVPFGQPALALAAQLQRQAARTGVPDELALLDAEPSSGAPVSRSARVRKSAVSYSGWWQRLVLPAVILKWSCALRRAATATSCKLGNAGRFRRLFFLASVFALRSSAPCGYDRHAARTEDRHVA